MVERYITWRRRSVSATSVNRELASLRRLLNAAKEWKVIKAVPKIKLLSGERQRDFVLSHQEEQPYLEAAPEPVCR